MIRQIRSRIRRHRFFYKPEARSIYRKNFRNWQSAYLLPFSRKPLCRFRRPDGSTLVMPVRHWPMLAATCRLIEAGAGVSWLDDEVEVRVGDCTFRAPADCRLPGLSIQGVFLDDTWRFRNLDLDGKIVMNVGGHIGIVAVALVRKGATVHVFEPFETFARYLRKNAAANGLPTASM